ncbi:MAG: hypothetical protein ABT940_05245 [Alphaproteobacteria bacterium]
MKIAFHSNQLGLRGAEVAVYDYAHFSETLLGHQSVVLYQASNKDNDPLVVGKFRDRFPLFGYDDFQEVDGILKREKVDRFYQLKAGENDGRLSRELPNLVHAVFPVPPEEAHGEIFAFVSEWLSEVCSQGTLPFVPHMIHLPSHDLSLREHLKIPEEAFVFGCYGGYTSFDIPFVHQAVMAALDRRRDLYFLFMNIAQFVRHPRVFHFKGVTDLSLKVAFINTCDAMLHGRSLGESFGIACGEFSIKNKPVAAYRDAPHRNHIHILGKKGIYYGNYEEVMTILLDISHDFVNSRTWDCYSTAFAPPPVMEQFQRVFLDDPIPAV